MGLRGALPGLDETWSLAPYEGVLREFVLALKLRARVQLAPPMAEAMFAAAPPGLLDGVLVPVPPSPSRWRERGHDPAVGLATALAQAAGTGLADCLERADGLAQAGRSRAARLSDPPRVRLAGDAPLRAVLVDDVLTTGATLRSCGAALRAGGTAYLVAITFARTTGRWAFGGTGEGAYHPPAHRGVPTAKEESP